MADVINLRAARKRVGKQQAEKDAKKIVSPTDGQNPNVSWMNSVARKPIAIWISIGLQGEKLDEIASC